MKKFLKGFVYAWRGIMCCLKERNFRFHLCAAAFVVFFAAGFYNLEKSEWAALVITIGAVIALEAVNTAIEHLADEVSTEKRENIRLCKDCAAAAVLIAAIAAVAVGVFLLGDVETLQRIWGFYSADVWRLVSLIAAVIGAVMVVLLPERYKK